MFRSITSDVTFLLKLCANIELRRYEGKRQTTGKIKGEEVKR